jgi:pyridoxine kinase
MILHETYSVPNVVISSSPVEEWLKDLIPPNIHASADDHEQSLLCLASVRTANSDSTSNRPPSMVYAACIPLIPGYFSGVGDLFSALVLGHYSAAADNDGGALYPPTLPPLPRAVSLALTKTHAVLRLTVKYASSLPPDERTTTDDELDKKDHERLIRRMRGRELRLIQGRKILSGEAMGELRWLKEWVDFWGPN